MKSILTILGLLVLVYLAVIGAWTVSGWYRLRAFRRWHR